jgi:ubiquitin-protein ligase
MMLTSPNKDSAYGTYKNLYNTDYSGYLKKAREMTREYAK